MCHVKHPEPESALNCIVDVSPGTHPKVTHTKEDACACNWPLTSSLLIHGLYWSSCVSACVFTHMCWCVLWQDMGQDVETYYQEVLAALEQSAEEGCRGERGALRSRLQQLFTEIVSDTDSGRSSLKRKSGLQSHAWLCLSVVELLTLSHQVRKLSWTWVKGGKNHKNHRYISLSKN